LIDSLFPPRSVLTLTAHPASLQYELQNIFDRGIVETIKLERESDRMSFTSGFMNPTLDTHTPVQEFSKNDYDKGRE
jgi:hypothetical protein